MMWDVSLGAGEQDKQHATEFLFTSSMKKRETEIVEMEIMIWDVSLGAGEQDKKYKQATNAF